MRVEDIVWRGKKTNKQDEATSEDAPYSFFISEDDSIEFFSSGICFDSSKF